MFAFLLNNTKINTDLPSSTIVLDLIRNTQGLSGTRSACREGDCGTCLILSGDLKNGRMHYRPLNSCILPVGLSQGRHLVSIEGINTEKLNPIQCALVEQGAIQCGFCTPGLVMALTAFFLNTPHCEFATAIEAVSGNLCRCTGYAGIKRALSSLCKQFDLTKSAPQNRINDLIAWRILPAYFAEIPQRVESLSKNHSLNNLRKNNKECTDIINVAGGTDLFVQKAEELIDQPLYFIPSNESISLKSKKCVIHASTHFETLRTSSLMQNLFSRISADFRLICSPSVRQQATLGGNLVNASPIADCAVFFLALGASLKLTISDQSRTVALRDFYQGYKQPDLRPGEMLDCISFDCPEIPLCFSFEKVSKRMHLDIASVNSAMLIEEQDGVIRNIHISAGGVAEVPLYLQKTCDWLLQKEVSVSAIKQALKIVQTEISPIDDFRGSAEYKRLLLKQLIIAHFLKLLPNQLNWNELQ